MSIFKDCDIRGVYRHGDHRTADAVPNRPARWRRCCMGGGFVVGGDARLSTPALKDALMRRPDARPARRCTDLGTDPHARAVLRPDAAATPTRARRSPPLTIRREYNGIKFMLGDEPVTRDTIDRVRDIALRGDYPTGRGTMRSLGTRRWITWTLSHAASGIAKPLHVLIDAGNGAMSAIAPGVFAARAAA